MEELSNSIIPSNKEESPSKSDDNKLEVVQSLDHEGFHRQLLASI
jgi:hypothetical protein